MQDQAQKAPSRDPSGAAPSQASFFRQSGWMLMASTACGFCMSAVHLVAKEMPKAEYGVFMTLLQFLNMMTIPVIGLQLVFVQQTVAAITEPQRRQLAGTIRGVLSVAFGLWIALALTVFFFQANIVEAYKIANPAAVWVTVCLALLAVSTPVMMGILQGRMNFLWLGWTQILNGLGRFVAIAVIVLVLGGYAAGAMTGALIGILISLAIAAWHTRDLWLGPAEPMRWKPWLRRLIPLSFGFGSATVMLSFDMIVVQRFFPKDETGYYAAAGMIGRALVFLTAPLTQVMFPRVVQAAARAEKTNVVAQALGVTALLGGLAALGCTVLPELPLRIIYDRSFLKVAPLVPWFAWCMLPLTLTNVLINNLLARERFAVVPWLVLVATAYASTLWILQRHFQNASFQHVVQTLGLFATLYLALCLFFTWRSARPTPS